MKCRFNAASWREGTLIKPLHFSVEHCWLERRKESGGKRLLLCGRLQQLAIPWVCYCFCTWCTVQLNVGRGQMCLRPRVSTNCSQRCTCTGCMLLLPPFYNFPPSVLGWVVVWDTCTQWHSHTNTPPLYFRITSCAVAVACVLEHNLELPLHGLPTQHPHATPFDACLVAHQRLKAGGEKTVLSGQNMTSFASWSTRLLLPEQSPPLPAFARSRPCVACTHSSKEYTSYRQQS